MEQRRMGILARLAHLREATVIIIIVGLVAVISLFQPIFLSPDNLRTTAIGFSCDCIIAIGMTLALISGGFDLSVGSVMGLAAVLAAGFSAMGLNIWVGAVLALVVCMAVGLLNGVLIGKVGINPFITTLGMMEIARGAVLVITEGSSLSIKAADQSFRFLGRGELIGIPAIVLIFLVLTVLGDFFVRRSMAAMKVFYVGSNEKAAILSGIDAPTVKIMVYVFTALVAGLAGILSVSRFGVATANMGDGAEMRVISAAVIGGASLTGGEGTVFGTVLGVLLLSIINNALVLFNVSVHWQSLISGTILICAVAIDTLSHKARAAKI